MAEEFQGSLSSFNLWSSLKCSDVFSCSTAVNAADIEESFGCFPAATDILELSRANSFENLTQPLSLDFFSSSIDWPHSFLESSETNFQAALPEDRSATGQCKVHMNFTETSQDSSMDTISTHGFFQSDQTLSESAMDEIQILPTVNGSPSWSTTASNAGSLTTSFITNPTAKSKKTVSRDSSLPIAKKIRIETPSPLPAFKVRKEKLGDRITALQQLVSPFGKTDTASVLHEAIEYIKFLHEQVNGLSNPYLINGHQKTNQQILERHRKNGDWAKQDLRSLGLCLVPISTTFAVARSELLPMDFWTQLWSMENYYSMRREI